MAEEHDVNTDTGDQPTGNETDAQGSDDSGQDQDLGIVFDDENDDDQDLDQDTDDDQDGDEGEDTETKPKDDPKKEINQEAVQKKINKIHREKKLAEESAAIERNKRIMAEQKIAELTETRLPPVPAPADVLDPDYTAKAEYREKVIYAHGMQAAQIKVAEEQRVNATRNAQAEDTRAVEGMVKTFETNADTLKINKKSLISSQNVIVPYLTGKQNLARFLLNDPNGPLNVMYLAQDAEELEKVSNMTETAAAAYIATTITKKASKLKPKKQSKAPKPTYTPSGRTHISDDDPRIAGATFE